MVEQPDYTDYGPSGYDYEQNNPNAVIADEMREVRVVNNILKQINPENLLDDIEHRIRNEKRNKISGEWESIVKGQKRISDELVSDFMGFLGAYLTQNTSMSNFTEAEINNLMESVIDWIGDNFYVNSEKYGLEKNYTERTRIGNIICISVFSVLKRAAMGTESKRVFASMRVTEANIVGQPQSFGDKIKSSLKFW